MHYLIIAVLAFGLSLMGCEGKTGPAGPSGSTGAAGPAGPAGPQGSTGPQGATGPQGPEGPQGPAGADGADGADGAKGDKGDKGDPGETGPAGPAGEAGPAGPAGADGATGPAGPAGPQGEAGPAGPQGPAGIVGIDPALLFQVGQADHIAFKIGGNKIEEGDGGDLRHSIRIGQTHAIKAAVFAQNGDELDLLDVVLTTESESITLSDDMTMIEGVEKTDAGKEAVIMASNSHAGLSAELKVSVSNPVHKVVLKDSDGNDITSAIVLAIDEDAEITAVAMDKAGDVIEHMGLQEAWSWDSATSGIVDVESDPKVENGRTGTVTGKSAGETMITAMAEGKSGSITVRVTPGQTTTRFMRASTSDQPTNAFTAVKDGSWAPDAIKFRVTVYDLVSNDAIESAILGAAYDETLLTVTFSNNGETGNDGSVEITVTGNGTTNAAHKSKNATITLTTVGADPIKVNFTLTVTEE